MASREDEIRIVLIGKTGAGKSATANTIVGRQNGKKNTFKETCGFDSDTRVKQCEEVCRFGKKIKVVDTPGLFENRKNQLDNAHIEEEVKKAFVDLSPGPHAIVFVVSAIGRYGDEDRKTADTFLALFGEKMLSFLFVVFTGGDEFKREDRDIGIEIRNTQQVNLQNLLEKCDGRYVMFDNRATEEDSKIQVEKLINDILENVKKNGGKYYTNSIFDDIEKYLKMGKDFLKILTAPIWGPFVLIHKGVSAVF